MTRDLSRVSLYDLQTEIMAEEAYLEALQHRAPAAHMIIEHCEGRLADLRAEMERRRP